jgi:hypothetical protein
MSPIRKQTTMFRRAQRWLISLRLESMAIDMIYLVMRLKTRWVCAVFSSDGAIQIIKRAKQHDLQTYYPIRQNHNNEYVPMWRPYLFIQWNEVITINLCRTTSKFVKIISARDDDGIMQPVRVRKDAVSESLRMMTQGKFDEKKIMRRYYGKGSLVLVIDGVMHDRTVRLEADISPEMKGNHKVPISIDNWKGLIEIHKLAL